MIWASLGLIWEIQVLTDGQVFFFPGSPVFAHLWWNILERAVPHPLQKKSYNGEMESHLDIHCLPVCPWFMTNPIFAKSDASKFKEGIFHFRNSRLKGLIAVLRLFGLYYNFSLMRKMDLRGPIISVLVIWRCIRIKGFVSCNIQVLYIQKSQM